ncbi:MAG: endonuclease III domain-containing protein [Endomicrobiales bacterium]|nr:endonuclease III domain-containing protein [Endomicrobiales bacterium]
MKEAKATHTEPFEIYKKLYNFFGPQGWWPTTNRGSLKPGYFPLFYKDRTGKEKFEICAGAILTQNTSWKNVEKAIVNLNKAKALDVKVINRIAVNKLATLIKPSGYYNQKAKRLKSFVRYFVSGYNGRIGKFLEKDTNEARRELLSLSGIGPETADSILLYAGNKPVFVVDAYTRRIGRRLGWFGSEGYDSVQIFFQSHLPKSIKIYNEYHALLVALGKDFCRKKPICRNCPLKQACKSGS